MQIPLELLIGPESKRTGSQSEVADDDDDDDDDGEEGRERDEDFPFFRG
jgi:hypothetical protein